VSALLDASCWIKDPDFLCAAVFRDELSYFKLLVPFLFSTKCRDVLHAVANFGKLILYGGKKNNFSLEVSCHAQLKHYSFMRGSEKVFVAN